MSGVLDLDKNLSQRVAQKQEESCTEGMGQLKGYCGTYQGLVTEEEDQAGKCNLIQNPISMTLDPSGTINLYSGQSPNEIIQNKSFFQGRINFDPQNSSIELSSRNCRPMPGIKFPNDHCKRQRLAGAFNYFNRSKHFYGFYTIINERTGQSCRYRLSFDQLD